MLKITTTIVSMSKVLTSPALVATPGMAIRQADFFRVEAGAKLDPERRSELGQFFTPTATARLMADMLETASTVRLLDPGAGVGSLTGAAVEAFCSRHDRPENIHAVVYEIDPRLLLYLRRTLELCERECEQAGVRFSFSIRNENFLEAAVSATEISLFRTRDSEPPFTHIITNPPYRKIRSDSTERAELRRGGIETSNLYSGFLAVAIRLLRDGGQLVSITPRSFCNGTYFREFRREFLSQMTIRRVHVFESREQAFRDDEVLQENVIIDVVKAKRGEQNVTITSSEHADDEDLLIRHVPQRQVVDPDDRDYFIHIVPDELEQSIADTMASFDASLGELGIEVSTGRVVDFRAADCLRKDYEEGSVPLIYPTHLANGSVTWPKQSKKPNAIHRNSETETLLVPTGHYVLVKRFSAKEEPRRVVAAVFDPSGFPDDVVAFENHLNYYHERQRPLSRELALGLAVFLNSSLVDSYFRHFNGHTQVNAGDLRKLRYPTRLQLIDLGKKSTIDVASQHTVDKLVEEELPQVATAVTAIRAKRKIVEALGILQSLGFPRQQQNERSALTLLAALNLQPRSKWSEAGAPLRGITQMMDFFADEYGKKYAPNSRETVRRQTVHQFVAAGLLIPNPDKPERPINSGKTVYQIEPTALKLIQTYGSAAWQKNVEMYSATAGSLAERHAQARSMNRIPITVRPGKTITISPGGQNVLLKLIIEEFCPLFTPAAELVYVGDTDEKWAFFDAELLDSLDVEVDSHGKMPDVIVYMRDKNWLILIEAVTSHGPVSPKRRDELRHLFDGSTAGLVLVTAFPDKRTMIKYLYEISWETEVWVADTPTHMIHFNGERFLGPYE